MTKLMHPFTIGAMALATLLTTGLAGGAIIDDLPGVYTGGWHNTTFGSSGDISFTITRDNGTFTLIADAGGNVFGQSDPPPVEITGTIVGDSVQFELQDDPFFGDITGEVTDLGQIVADFSNIPGGSIQQVTLNGNIEDGVINLDYLVVFSQQVGGGAAAGDISAIVPEPATLTLLAASALALLRRRRLA